MPDTQEHPHHDNSFWIGLFLGGLIGALIVVVLGTEKGKRLAKRLQEEGLDFWDEASEKVGDEVEKIEEKGAALVEKGQELIDQGKKIEERVMMKAEEVKDNVVQQTVAQADATLAHIEQLQERGRATTAELRRKLFKNIPKKPAV